MGLRRGETNNPNGRPKGSQNKVSAELRERLTAFVENHWEQVEADFDALEPKERLQFFEKLLSYTLPKLQSVKHEADTDTAVPTITIFELPHNGRDERPTYVKAKSG